MRYAFIVIAVSLPALGCAGSVKTTCEKAVNEAIGAGASITRDVKTNTIIGISFNNPQALIGVDLSGLECLQSLTTVDFGQSAATDEMVAFTAKLRRIEDLNFAYTRISDRPLIALAEQPSLKKLNVKGTAIGQTGIIAICKMKGLKSLNCDGVTFDDESAAQLEHLNPLRELSLSRARVNGWEWLKKQKELYSLDLSWTKANDADARAIALMLNLTDLDLGHLPVSDETFLAFTVINLCSLNLNATKVSDKGISHLASAKKLHSLHLRNTLLSDAGLNALSALTLSETLDVSDTRITSAAIKTIKKFGGLQRLSMSNIDISSRSIDGLLQLRRLRGLSLRGCTIEDRVLVRLGDLRELRTLDLTNSRVNEDSIRDLRLALPSLVIVR